MLRSCVALGVVLLGVTAEICTADELPQRKAGLWEVQTSSQGRTTAVKQCIDENTDAKMLQLAGQIGQNCKKQESRREGNTYVAEAECDLMGSHIQSKATMKGDFSSNYTGTVTATYDPPLMGKKEGTTQIAARWIGPCLADQQPGDMIMPNGMKMNMEALSKVHVPR